MAETNSNIKWETRLCEVDGRVGYFHTWEQYSQPVEASPLQWGHPAGVVAQVFAIVEFEDGVERVLPYKVKFIDFTNTTLTVINKENARMKEKENSDV